MARVPGPLALALALAAVFSLASPAQAFVRETVDGRPDLPLYWARRDLVLRPALTSSEDVSEGALRAALVRAVGAWETAGDGCTDLSFSVGAEPASLRTNLDGGTNDGENRVVFRETEWPADSTALALTTLVYRRDTGEIVDADIDVNGEHHFWTVTDEPGAVVNDVQNTLTHELGHLLGFAHSEDVEATMFGRSAPGETSKRELGGDDVAAACSVYPFGEPTSRALGTIRRGLTSGAGCSVSALGGGPTPSAALAAAGLLGLLRRRRRLAPSLRRGMAAWRRALVALACLLATAACADGSPPQSGREPSGLHPSDGGLAPDAGGDDAPPAALDEVECTFRSETHGGGWARLDVPTGAPDRLTFRVPGLPDPRLVTGATLAFRTFDADHPGQEGLVWLNGAGTWDLPADAALDDAESAGELDVTGATGEGDNEVVFGPGALEPGTFFEISDVTLRVRARIGACPP